MASLLLNERPLVVLPGLAEALGSVDEAIILQQLHYWVSKSKHVHDGHRWVYNTLDAWMSQFPWIKSKTTLKKHLNRLAKQGLVLKGNYNKAGFDRTAWYSIDYQQLELFTAEFEAKKAGDAGPSMSQKMAHDEPENGSCKGQKMAHAEARNCPTNTIDYTETTTETTTYTAEQAESLPEEMQEKEKKEKIPYKKILEYLNEKTGKHYRNVPTNQELIRARWNEGYTFDDFKNVIDNMVAKWKGTGFTFSSGELAENYLQPSTLFSRKFDKYLNQTVNSADNVPEEYQGLFDQQPDIEAGEYPF